MEEVVLGGLGERDAELALEDTSPGGPCRPTRPPAPGPDQPDDDGRCQAGEEAGQDDIGLTGEGDGRRDEDDRVDGRGGEQERQCGRWLGAARSPGAPQSAPIRTRSRAAPFRPAPRWARRARDARESTRGRNPAGTKATMAPLTTTPSTRNGKACTVMDTKMVDQLWTAGSSNQPPATNWSPAAARSTPTSTPRPGRQRRARESPATPRLHPTAATSRQRYVTPWQRSTAGGRAWVPVS